MNDKILENIEKVLVGKKETAKLLLTALLSGGHVLLEDVPGTGKTLLAKTFAHSLDLSFSRIQFTPDLLPTDVSGLNFFHQKEGDFVFREGPIFTHVLLADEINRATPRTQSALLECMEEHQVTVDGVTRPLQAPFFVVATENPVETTGTFPLPEAQLDRFMMKLPMGNLSKEEEIAVLSRFLKDQPLDSIVPVSTIEELEQAMAEVKNIFVHPVLLSYMAALAQETRKASGVLNGVSPRGTLALLHAAMAYAYVNGRNFVVPEDIKTLAVPVFAHRLVLDRSVRDSHARRQIVEKILASVPVPTEDWAKN